METESIQRVELSFKDWLWKIGEKIIFAKMKVQDKQDVGEDFYAMARPLFGVWWNGAYPLHENRLDIPVEEITQQGLFADADNVADENSKEVTDVQKEANGTVLAEL